jgi:hypothetical protein
MVGTVSKAVLKIELNIGLPTIQCSKPCMSDAPAAALSQLGYACDFQHHSSNGFKQALEIINEEIMYANSVCMPGGFGVGGC